MSRTSMFVHRKLKDAFATVVDNNRARSVLFEKPDITKSKIMSAQLCVHGSGAITSFPALSLQVKRHGINQLFCFNLHPNLDRHYTKGKHAHCGVFFTRLHWDNQALGALHYLASPFFNSPISAQPVPIHGPQGLKAYLENIYEFMLAPKMKDRFYERSFVLEDDTTYSENGIVIDKIFAHASSIERTTDTKFVDSTVSYVCQINDFELRIDKNKLNLESKTYEQDSKAHKDIQSFYEKIYRGEDAVNPVTGDLVHAQDVLMKPYSTCFAVVDCPTAEHFFHVEDSPKLKKLSLESTDVTPRFMAHLTPNKLFYSGIYQRWLEGFGDCKHLILNDASKIQYSKDEFQQIFTFNRMCPDLFPPVLENFFPDESESDQIVKGHEGLSYHMNKLGEEDWNLDHTSRACDLNAIKTQWIDTMNKDAEIIDEVSRDIQVTKDETSPGYFPRLVVLGSGGTHTQKYRAHPGFFLMLNEKTSVLLECGELALDRIYKIFHRDAENVLASLKLIFLSHIHIDHHCGFLTLLERVAKIRRSQNRPYNKNDKIFCLLPFQMCHMYQKFTKHLMDQIIMCPITYTNSKDGPLEQRLKTRIEKAVGLKNILPVHVTHSVRTCGITLVTGCGKKIAYSADALPKSKELIRHGRNADLLIHDCLYVDDDFEVEANIRKHSTLKGALETAKMMNAKFTLLTHFAPTLPVQPIDHIPVNNAAAAYDFLMVSLNDLPELRKLEPVIRAVYKDSINKRHEMISHNKDRKTQRMAIIRELAELM